MTVRRFSARMTTSAFLGERRAPMTKQQIDEVLDRVHTWPLERQEKAAAMLLKLEEQSAALYELTDDEIAEIEEAEAEAAHGELADAAEMQALSDSDR
jgi:hypothetical protein